MMGRKRCLSNLAASRGAATEDWKMADNLSTSFAEVFFDVDTGTIKSCWVAGKDGSQYVGHSMDEFLRAKFFEGLSEQSRSLIEEALSPQGAGDAGVSLTLTKKLVDPKAIDKKLSFAVGWEGERQETGILSVTDVTAELLAEGFYDQLASAELLLVGIVDAAKVDDAEGRCTVCEPGDLREGLARKDDERYAVRLEEIIKDAVEEKKDELRQKASLKKVCSQLDESSPYSLYFECKGKGGPSYRQIRWSYLDREDKTLAMTVTDVTELYSELMEARDEAEHDFRTGAFNGRGGERRAVEEYRRVLDDDDAECSVIMFDIDNFKEFNDGFGHEMGDDVLKKFHSIMKEADVGEHILYRYGGDEFAMLVPGVGRDAAEGLKKSILDAAKKLFVETDAGDRIDIYISAGIDWFKAEDIERTEGSDDPDDGTPLGAVKKAIKRADTKLYEVKKVKHPEEFKDASDSEEFKKATMAENKEKYKKATSDGNSWVEY